MTHISHILRNLLIGLALLVGVAAVFQPAPAYAAFQSNAAQEACQGVGVGSGGCTSNPSKITDLIKNITNIFSAIVGIAAVIMIIAGGFKYITSAGDSAKAASAKNTIIYAVVGLVIVAFSQFIVQFVLNKT